MFFHIVSIFQIYHWEISLYRTILDYHSSGRTSQAEVGLHRPFRFNHIYIWKHIIDANFEDKLKNL